jgi:hypothetical protein
MAVSDQDPDPHGSAMVRLPGSGPRSTLTGLKLEIFDSRVFTQIRPVCFDDLGIRQKILMV